MRCGWRRGAWSGAPATWGAYPRRQRSRLGSPEAVTATAHKLARIVYHLLRYGVAYVKQQEEAYAAQVRERLEKQLRRRAQELGFEVIRTEAAAGRAGSSGPCGFEFSTAAILDSATKPPKERPAQPPGPH